MKYLVTGNAGFIGFHTVRRLLERGDEVTGIDVVNDYYDVSLKRARLGLLADMPQAAGRYTFVEGDLADQELVDSVFEQGHFDRVIHLAAQAGVRYSLENPRAYVRCNIDAFVNILEACRAHDTPHLSFASTSSVYGANGRMPFSEHHGVDHPVQFYAATKKANELMAHSYSHLYGLPMTGLRFFTVYGPWGRPDMALFIFTRNILEGKPIPVFNHGHHARDFTYVDDIVEGVLRATDQVAAPSPQWNAQSPDPAISSAPYRIFNIGNGNPVRLMDMVAVLEDALGRKAEVDFKPLQPGDVPENCASCEQLAQAVGYRPQTGIDVGIRRFVDWYRDFYGT